MPKDKKSLPKPPQTPFGRKGAIGSQEEDELVADKMSMAMAKGKLGSFIENEFDGNENAAKLASMMMGMTGMGQGFAPPVSDESRESGGRENSGTQAPKPHESETTEPGDEIKGIEPSEEIMKATMSGDVKKLTELLREAAGRGKDAEQGAEQMSPEGPGAKAYAADMDSLMPGRDESFMEKEMLEKLIRMASENNVSVDWLIQRAIKLYLQDYQNTGRI